MANVAAAGLSARLARGIEQLSLQVPESRQQQMLQYLQLLQRWNRSYNLTSISEPEQMVDLHLLDSLSIQPYLFGEQVLDVGTGAGLPGMVLAMACPELRFLLLDSNIKKTRFLTQVRMELGLDNVTVVHSRLEQFSTETPPDTIVSRAFTSLQRFIDLAAPLAGRPGRLLAMKGRLQPQELAAAGEQQAAVQLIRLQVPGVEAERHLVQVEFMP